MKLVAEPTKSQAGCRTCGEVFANVALFDGHRTALGCVISRRLVRDDRGVWWTPAALDLSRRRVVALNKSRDK